MKPRKKPSQRKRTKGKRPVVFISHYADGDGDIAAKLKEWIETQYRVKNIAVFSSSSEHEDDISDNSIKSGTLSMSSIGKNLASHDVLISLLTPASVKRLWVVFEAGVGFGKGKAFIPILCRGGKLSSLPQPFSDLYVREASSKPKFNTILKEIDKALGCKHTNVGVEELRTALCEPTVQQFLPAQIDNDDQRADEIVITKRWHRPQAKGGGISPIMAESTKIIKKTSPHPESYVPSSKGNEISGDIDDNSISHD